jgi:hypothetical protein
MNKLLALVVLIVPMRIFAGEGSEQILYNLKLGFLKGGEAKINITDTIFEGKKAIHYRLEVKTTGLADALYQVFDVYESTVDPETQLPYVSIRNAKERKYRYYNEVTYYRNIDSLYSQRSGWQYAPPDVVDIITVFFYFTNQNYIEKINLGEMVTLPTMHADEINNIHIKFLGFEVIDTQMGNLECYVLSPQVKKGKLLKRSDGIKLYITKDSKLPVLLEFDMRVGALRAILKDYDTNNL